jgi:molecular chaperone GrpE
MSIAPEDEVGRQPETAGTEAPAPGTGSPAATAESASETDGAHGLVAVEGPPAPTREEYDSLQRECDRLRDQVLRRRADFENYRKRAERDKQQAGLEAVATVLGALIPILDSLDRALQLEATQESLREGVELIRREFQTLMESRGVTAHAPLGQPFDPNLHQALTHEEVPGFEDGTVVEVYRKGYFFGSRLLRPALVKVAKAARSELDPEVAH